MHFATPPPPVTPPPMPQHVVSPMMLKDKDSSYKSSLKSPEPKRSRSAQAEPNSSLWIPPEGLIVDDFETDDEAEEEPPKAAFSTRLRTLADEIQLVGTARSKEMHWRDMTMQQQVECKKAMAAEWSKWTEFSATKALPAKEMNALIDRGAKPVGCRWVLTGKPDNSIKARLVVQGCQERDTGLRTAAPTGSFEALMLTIQAGLEPGWIIESYDAKTAYLQSGKIDRVLVLRMPRENPPPGVLPGGLLLAQGSIYGIPDAARAWYQHSRGALVKEQLVESRFERAW